MMIEQLSDEDLVRAGLDPLTRRDLIAHPPQPAETMQQIGISDTNLDGPVRSWINGRFRKPRGKAVLTRGAIKGSTTWAQLLGFL